MIKRHLEFRKDNERKFWQIRQSGSSLKVTFGRIGARGQSNTKKFDSPSKAYAAAVKRIAEKLGRGYADARVKHPRDSPKKLTIPKAGQSIPSEIAYRTKRSPGSDSVTKTWQRLESWFKKHLPQVLQALNPPASLRDIKLLEKTLGQELPASLRETFRRHDGQLANLTGPIFGLELLSVRESIACLKNYKRYERTKATKYNFDEYSSCFPTDWVQAVDASGHWIPLVSDGGGNQIVVDMAPGPKGTNGQVVICGRDDTFHPVLARNWEDFLADIATELKRGNFMIIEHQGTAGLEFTIGTPRTHHFHDVGVEWSRRKLGLRKLLHKDQAVWMKRKKIIDSIAASWTGDACE